MSGGTSFPHPGGYRDPGMRSPLPLPPVARLLRVWALVVLLLGASSLIHACRYLCLLSPSPTASALQQGHGAAHVHAHPQPSGQAPSPQSHAHLGDCTLCIAHAIQVAPPTQAPQSSLLLVALVLLPASAVLARSALLLPYDPRAPPAGPC